MVLSATVVLVVERPWDALMDVTDRRNATIPWGNYLRHAEVDPELRADGTVAWTDEVDMKVDFPGWLLNLMGTDKIRTTGTCVLDRDKRVRTAERRNIDFADRITLVESARIAAITDSSTRYEMTATVDCNVWGVAYAVEKLVSIFYAGLYDEDKYYQKTDPHYQAVQDAGGAVKLTRAEARAYLRAGRALPPGVAVPVRRACALPPSRRRADPAARCRAQAEPKGSGPENDVDLAQMMICTASGSEKHRRWFSVQPGARTISWGKSRFGKGKVRRPRQPLCSAFQALSPGRCRCAR